MPLSPRSRFIANATIGYLVFAAAWIFFSDQLLDRFVGAAELTAFATTKGLIFVGLTAALLFTALQAVPPEGNPTARRSDGKRIGGKRLAAALVFPLVAFALQWAFWQEIQPFAWLLFCPAVFFSSWIGGLPGGLCATGLSTLLVWYGFIPPRFSFVLDNPHSAISIGIFFAMGVLFAITNGRLRKAERRAADAKFRALVDQSLAGIYILQDGHFRYANLAFARIFGYGSPDDLVELLPIEAVVAEEDRPMVLERIRQRISGEVSESRYTFRGRCADDSKIDVGIHGRFFIHDGRPAVIGVALDVSDRLRAERAWAESDLRLRQALAASQMGVWELEIASKTVYWSPECYRLFGVTGISASFEAFKARLAEQLADAVEAMIAAITLRESENGQ